MRMGGKVTPLATLALTLGLIECEQGGKVLRAALQFQFRAYQKTRSLQYPPECAMTALIRSKASSSAL